MNKVRIIIQRKLFFANIIASAENGMKLAKNDIVYFIFFDNKWYKFSAINDDSAISKFYRIVDQHEREEREKSNLVLCG